MKRHIRRAKERLSDRKGITTIEIAISAMMIIVALAGFMDMVNMSQRLDTASSVTGYIGRVAASQGGVQEQPPKHFVGNYVSTTQMYREVKTTLQNGGIKEEDFSLIIDGHEIKPGTNVPVVTFGNKMNIELKVKYKWEFIGGALGTELGSEKSSQKSVVSSFKVRDADITSEFEN